MELEKGDFKLKLHMKYIVIIFLIIAVTVLMLADKIKEPGIFTILSTFCELYLNKTNA